MRLNALLAMTVGAMALLAGGIETKAGEGRTARMETTASTGQPKARYYRKKRAPLQVNIYRGRRIGGYSYSTFDAHSTYGSSPPPYAHVRQTPSGPFDNGFFFDSGVRDVGVGSRGGDSPYIR